MNIKIHEGYFKVNSFEVQNKKFNKFFIEKKFGGVCDIKIRERFHAISAF